jgi:signal transduction histidine kinase/CheY-like chemotaxis protein
MAAPPPARTSRKILIVDNNPVIIELLSHFFSEQGGHEVRAAEDGLSALHVLDTFVPDIMFVDLVMPNISGDKLCRIVRATPVLSHVYLIVLSAIVVDDEINFRDFGANACIAKGPLAKMQEHISAVLDEVAQRQLAVDDDRIIGIEGLTEREITRELLEANRSFTVILENMVEGVLQLTSHREIILANRAAAGLLATPEEKLLSTDFLDYFSGDSQARVAAIFTDWRGVAQEFGEEEAVMLGNRRVTLQLLPARGAQAETMLVILHDVTERKAGEANMARYREHLEAEVRQRTQELEESNQRFLSILDGIDCFIHVVDLESCEVLFMNRFGQKQLGGGTGRSCWALSQNDQQGPCAECPIVRFRADMVETREPVVWEKYNSKAGCWFEKHDRVIRWFDGRLVKMGLAFDVTARKAAEAALSRSRDDLEARVAERTAEIEKLYQQLLHAAKMSAVGKLAASVAHEFNNPICGIRNVLDGLARRRDGLDAENRHMVELAIRECDRVAKLTSDLQSFNRPTSGKVSQVDVRAALDDILLLCKKEFKSHNIILHKEYAQDLPTIRAVADQIKQVFLNLLTNAREAIGEGGGTVTVTTEGWGDQIVIRFADTGCGIAPEALDHIFEPFFSTKPEVKGTGLGLAVSYGIVQRHGGDIKVESKPGHGARFTVVLPSEGNVV